MLLNRILGRVRRDEQGVALIAVIGVMAVGVVVGSVILTSILSGIGFTASTRAGVQSQAGADAGLAAVQAGLRERATERSASAVGTPRPGVYGRPRPGFGG